MTGWMTAPTTVYSKADQPILAGSAPPMSEGCLRGLWGTVCSRQLPTLSMHRWNPATCNPIEALDLQKFRIWSFRVGCCWPKNPTLVIKVLNSVVYELAVIFIPWHISLQHWGEDDRNHGEVTIDSQLTKLGVWLRVLHSLAASYCWLFRKPIHLIPWWSSLISLLVNQAILFSFVGCEMCVGASGGGARSEACDTWISRSQNAHKNCRKQFAKFHQNILDFRVNSVHSWGLGVGGGATWKGVGFRIG
jgi:hypothetical protein